MFARYKRLVPRPQRELIAEQRLPKPNWFVGAAEQPLNPQDPALMQQIKAVKRRIRDRGNPQAPVVAPDVPPLEARTGVTTPGAVQQH